MEDEEPSLSEQAAYVKLKRAMVGKTAGAVSSTSSLWGCLETRSQLDALIESLNPLGSDEFELLVALRRCYSRAAFRMDRWERSLAKPSVVTSSASHIAAAKTGESDGMPPPLPKRPKGRHEVEMTYGCHDTSAGALLLLDRVETGLETSGAIKMRLRDRVTGSAVCVRSKKDHDAIVAAWGGPEIPLATGGGEFAAAGAAIDAQELAQQPLVTASSSRDRGIGRGLERSQQPHLYYTNREGTALITKFLRSRKLKLGITGNRVGQVARTNDALLLKTDNAYTGAGSWRVFFLRGILRFALSLHRPPPSTFFRYPDVSMRVAHFICST